jgi:hypothetical protein
VAFRLLQTVDYRGSSTRRSIRFLGERKIKVVRPATASSASMRVLRFFPERFRAPVVDVL